MFQELQAAVLQAEAVDYLVSNLVRRQHKQAQSDDTERSARALWADIDRVVSAITAMGHSDALIATLQKKEAELRELSVAKQANQALDPEEIRHFVGTQFRMSRSC